MRLFQRPRLSLKEMKLQFESLNGYVWQNDTDMINLEMPLVMTRIFRGYNFFILRVVSIFWFNACHRYGTNFRHRGNFIRDKNWQAHDGFLSQESTIVKNVHKYNNLNSIFNCGIIESINLANNTAPQSSSRDNDSVFIGATFIFETKRWELIFQSFQCEHTALRRMAFQRHYKNRENQFCL